MEQKKLTVLAIGAHIGDAELTAGALLASCAVRHLCGCTGNRNHTVFKGLAKRLADALGEFGKLVKEKNTVVGKRNLTGSGICTAAYHTRRADGVVGRTEGTLGDQIRAKNTCNRVNFRGFHRLLKAHIGENGGKALGKH